MKHRWSCMLLTSVIGCVGLTSCGGAVSNRAAEEATKKAQSDDPAYNPAASGTRRPPDSKAK